MADRDYPRHTEYEPYAGGMEEDLQDFRDELFIGERVLGVFGNSIGTVSELMDYGFRVNRPYVGDITLPYTSIRDAYGERVHLNIPADQVGRASGRDRRGRYGYGGEWNDLGPYTGRGPRGYVRSDERIRDEVNDRLWVDDQLDATGIDVRVSDGIVTLEGVVDSRWAKRRAEDIAWSAPGVVDVLNNLRRARGDWDNWRDHMHAGMDVVGSLGTKVGTIDEIRDYEFLMNRSGKQGIWIPFGAIEDVRNDRAILNLPKDEIDRQGWATTATRPA